jgi:hypothetical protein
MLGDYNAVDLGEHALLGQPGIASHRIVTRRDATRRDATRRDVRYLTVSLPLP